MFHVSALATTGLTYLFQTAINTSRRNLKHNYLESEGKYSNNFSSLKNAEATLCPSIRHRTFLANLFLCNKKTPILGGKKIQYFRG